MADGQVATRTIDTSGLACPLPVLKARKALLAMAPGQRLALTATDPLAAIDVPHFCRQAGHRLVAHDEHDGVLHFTIERGDGAAEGEP